MNNQSCANDVQNRQIEKQNEKSEGIENTVRHVLPNNNDGEIEIDDVVCNSMEIWIVFLLATLTLTLVLTLILIYRDKLDDWGNECLYNNYDGHCCYRKHYMMAVGGMTVGLKTWKEDILNIRDGDNNSRLS